MFKEYKGLVNLNKLFLDKYSYDGTEDLFDQEFIEIELNGQREKFWFDYDNNKYLFKKQNNNSDDIYAEVVAEKIAEVLDINCAEYTLGNYNDEMGVISKNFVKENERLILGVEIMAQVLNKYADESEEFKKLYNIENLGIKDVHNKLNNLEDIWSILDLYFKDYNNNTELVNMCMQGLIKIFAFDLITMQGDRHIRNWGIVVNETDGYIRFAPVFDNSNICGLNRKSVKQTFDGMLKGLNKNINNDKKYEKSKEQLNQLLYHSKLLFSVSEDDIIDISSKKRKDNLDILDYFISISSTEYIDLISDYISKIQNIGIENIIVQKESEMGCLIPDDVKNHIINSINLNCEYINERINIKNNIRR